MKYWWIALTSVLAACGSAPSQSPSPQQERADMEHRARVHTELAAAYYSRGQYAVALEELNEAISSLPSYVPAHNMRGLTFMELGDDQEASKSFARALSLSPEDPEVNNNYGWYLCNRKQEKESIGYFTKALSNTLYASPEKAMVNAGICTRKLGDENTAANYFRRALAVRPDQSRANYHLADIAYRRGELKLAQSYIDRALQGPNTPADTLWLKVRIERKLGDQSAQASYALQLRNRFPQARETKLLQQGAYD